MENEKWEENRELATNLLIELRFKIRFVSIFISLLPILVTSVHSCSLDFQKSPSSYFIWLSRSATSRRKKARSARQEVDL